MVNALDLKSSGEILMSSNLIPANNHNPSNMNNYFQQTKHRQKSVLVRCEHCHRKVKLDDILNKRHYNRCPTLIQQYDEECWMEAEYDAWLAERDW